MLCCAEFSSVLLCSVDLSCGKWQMRDRKRESLTKADLQRCQASTTLESGNNNGECE